MDSPLSTLGFVIFGIAFSIYSVIAESQSHPTSVSPPPSSSRPPPPHLSPRPRPPPRFTPLPLPPPRSSPSTSPPGSLSPPPPRRFSPTPNLDQEGPEWKPKSPPANPNRPRHRPPPPPPSRRLNIGKKIGLLFAGIAGIMQIGVVGFLVFKRRQLLRTKDAFEASA